MLARTPPSELRPAPRPDLAAFLDAQARAWRAGAAYVEVRAGGLVRDGRPYVALPCGCAAKDCPGWALVHDDPEARAHFERLFGGGEG